MRFNNAKGFTLTEIVIVIVIIVILAAIALPAYFAWLPNKNVKAEATDLSSNLQRAKIQAINTNTTVTLVFNAGCPGTYTFTDGTGTVVAGKTTQNGVCLALQAGAAPFGFTSRGFAVGGGFTVRISHPNAARRYDIIQSVAGGIRLQ